MSKNLYKYLFNHCIDTFKLDVGTFCQNYGVETLSTLYLNVSGIIITSLKSTEKFQHGNRRIIQCNKCM